MSLYCQINSPWSDPNDNHYQPQLLHLLGCEESQDWEVRGANIDITYHLSKYCQGTRDKRRETVGRRMRQCLVRQCLSRCAALWNILLLYMFPELSQMIELTPVAFDISRSHSKSKRNLASSIFCQINHKLKAGPMRAQYPVSGPMAMEGPEEQITEGGASLDNIASSPALNTVSVSEWEGLIRYFL